MFQFPVITFLLLVLLNYYYYYYYLLLWNELSLIVVWQALYASKIVSYAQGFMLLREAAKIYNWDLNYGSIALMWRGGCIIRRYICGPSHCGPSRLCPSHLWPLPLYDNYPSSLHKSVLLTICVCPCFICLLFVLLVCPCFICLLFVCLFV